jgi:ribosomal protein S18 acetylase RimI-like enzyme
MNSPLQLRALRPEDLGFADSLRALAGWNQTLDDWRRFLVMEPTGCFLAEWNGVAAGTATTLVYGLELAWIGMVLVHPDHRRRGIGRALLNHCIASLRERGVRCIKLDATPEGKEVYVGLGFKEEWTLTRWEHEGLRAEPPDDRHLRKLCSSDIRLTVPLDSAAFGTSREKLAGALIAQSSGAWGYETLLGCLAGYGLIRAGARACYLGPVVAATAADGLPLVKVLLAHGAGERVFWDIPDSNLVAVAWAREQGFRPQRSLTRMFLGETTTPGDPRQQFGLAGPEVG